jgi:hypothetical protein
MFSQDRLNEKIDIISKERLRATNYFDNRKQNKIVQDTVGGIIKELTRVKIDGESHENQFNRLHRNFNLALDRTEGKIDPILDSLKDFSTKPNYSIRIKSKNIGK